jgi:predicted nucleic acid-binding protein
LSAPASSIVELVVDSSVAIKWFVTEPLKAQADRLLNDFDSGRLRFLAPSLIYAEIGNIVWKKQTQGDLDAAAATAILDACLTLKLETTPIEALLRNAHPIAVAHRRTLYDSLYVALSVQRGCRFVTADERLKNAICSTYPDVIWLGDL